MIESRGFFVVNFGQFIYNSNMNEKPSVPAGTLPQSKNQKDSYSEAVIRDAEADKSDEGLTVEQLKNAAAIYQQMAELHQKIAALPSINLSRLTSGLENDMIDAERVNAHLLDKLIKAVDQEIKAN